MTVVKVVTYPRVHMGLIDLSGATRRRYGGAGFALSTMPTTAVARLGACNQIRTKSVPEHRDLAGIRSALDRLSGRVNRQFVVDLSTRLPAHHGFGSKTAMTLAVLIACGALARGHDMSRAELVQISRRGGASGIGVNTVFEGGFIVDGGHAATSAGVFAPSSAVVPHEAPPVLVRLPFPACWRLHLFMPRGQRVFGAAEHGFFHANTPIPEADVLKTLAIVYHGVVPAVAEADFDLLRLAVRDLHSTGFKRLELEAQEETVRALFSSLSDCDELAVGMSSLGPLMYGIAPSELPLDVRFREVYGEAYLGSCVVRNRGAYIHTSRDLE